MKVSMENLYDIMWISGLKGLMEVQLYTCKFLANYKTLERTR